MPKSNENKHTSHVAMCSDCIRKHRLQEIYLLPRNYSIDLPTKECESCGNGGYTYTVNPRFLNNAMSNLLDGDSIQDSLNKAYKNLIDGSLND